MMGLDNPRILKRFTILLGVATFVMFSVWMMIQNYEGQTEGDYEVRQGDILLSDGKYEEAIKAFEEALTLQPDHRGALGGQAVALMGLGKDTEAESVLTYLIEFLKKTLAKDDPTGRGALAAAYGNRGILKDRQGRYEAALKDYIESVRLDKDLADGPGIVAQILYYEKEPSSILKRAEYLYKQMKLPKAERLMRRPEEDAKQRVYKP
ncbi:MAG: tetratricopeptide repeat protein [Rhodospirillales bacterium]|nr:tetratricopeptide repeat protein [Alphaproteobacteria bacterium]MBL6947208.1 tetratricopeptide repeat protein [Rhodospirillales bacterium]